MDHNSAEYFNLKMQALDERGSAVKMQDGKTFTFELDAPADERGADPPVEYGKQSMDHNSAEYFNLKMQALDERGSAVKMQDGKTFIFEEDAPADERGPDPPVEYGKQSMDHNSAEYLNLKMQALDERDTPVHPLPSAKTVSMRPIAQAEDLPAEFEEDEDIFAEADLAMEQMDELREQLRAEELKRLEHQFAEFEADYAAFEEEYGASEENIFSGAN